MGLVSVLAVVVASKLLLVQVLPSERHRAWDRSQAIRTFALPGPRGVIYDRNLADLALSVQAVTVFADPRDVADPRRAAEVVASVRPEVNADTLLSRLTRKGSSFTYVARQLEPKEADALMSALKDAGVEGFHTTSEPKRVEPAGELAGSVLGRVDPDGNGIAGIEQMFERTLKGVPGLRQVRAAGSKTIAATEVVTKQPEPGSSVVLTLDRNLQYIAEQALVNQVTELQAKGGVVVVGRPATGEILAVANVYTREDGTVAPTHGNFAFVSTFEAGSVMKMITAAATYNEGKVTSDERLQVPYSHKVAEHTYRDHDAHGVESWSVDDIIAKSSNVGTIMLAQRLKPSIQYRYLNAFGFGDPTAVGFEKETGGLLRDSDKWSSTDAASIAIGQGVAVTPAQIWAAYNVIANSGRYVPPRLVDATVAPDGTRHRLPTGRSHRVVSPETARLVTRSLSSVVERGTASKWKIPGYSIAAKTGTAYVPQPNGGYVKKGGGYEYTSAFSGFLPASDPQLSITVLIDRPAPGNHYGATAAGPVFNALARFGVQYLKIPQDIPVNGDDSADGTVTPVRAKATRDDPAVAGEAAGDGDPGAATPNPTAARDAAARTTATAQDGGDGAGDAGTDGAGDAGTGDAGDAGTDGAGDAGTDGAGDAGTGDAGDAGTGAAATGAGAQAGANGATAGRTTAGRTTAGRTTAGTTTAGATTAGATTAGATRRTSSGTAPSTGGSP